MMKITNTQLPTKAFIRVAEFEARILVAMEISAKLSMLQIAGLLCFFLGPRRSC